MIRLVVRKFNSFEAPYKLFGIGKSLTSKDKKIIFNVYHYLANREKEENAERPKKEKKKKENNQDCFI